ncbi:uncharacterized protein METZ01_LOCUS481874, partial [marine metagenome]
VSKITHVWLPEQVVAGLNCHLEVRLPIDDLLGGPSNRINGPTGQMEY